MRTCATRLSIHTGVWRANAYLRMKFMKDFDASGIEKRAGENPALE